MRTEPTVWLDPSEHEPPMRTAILMKTRNGTAVIGTWQYGGAYVAWQRLPVNGDRKPHWMAAREALTKGR